MIKQFIRYLLLILSIFTLTGCAVKEIGQTISNSVQGDYYLNNYDKNTGLELFKQRTAENPDSASANYYYGRFLLLNDSPKTSLNYFKKANQLSPQNETYLFWQAMAYAELRDTKNEEKYYRKALEANKNHIQSLVHLGHNLFERKRYKEALDSYNKAIALNPKQRSSLYNRALITKKLKRTPEEADAWKKYLEYYSTDSDSRKAVDSLLLLGHFDYRSYFLGARNVTVPKISFIPFSTTLTKSGKKSLNLIGEAASLVKKGKLQVIVYQLNNKDLAKQRAIAIKNYLTKKYPQLSSNRVGASWFATPQYLKVGSKKVRINESVDFFFSKN